MYGVGYSWSYIWQEVGGANFYNVLSLAAPHIAVIVGHLSLYTFWMMSLQTMGCLLVFMTSYLFLYQVLLVYNGQTGYERKQNLKLYDLGAKQNFLDVLGKRWYLAWLWPRVSSKLPGDGMNFKAKPRIEMLEDWKNL